MELISQIINNLIDDNCSLESALLKTKVLATRIGNENLLKWSNFELSGYENELDLPEYRKNIWNALKGNIISGNAFSGHWNLTDVEIPTLGIDRELEDNLRTTDFYENITSLDKLSQSTETLGSPVRAEVLFVLQKNLRKMGNPEASIISCNKIIPQANLTAILSSVRNKLLDFMLILEKEFGTITEITDLKLKNKEITQIMNHTIINTSGDGNSINTGNNSTISNSSTVTKNDIESLKTELRKQGVDEKDIIELAEIVQEENIDEKNNLGTKSRSWILKILDKSMQGIGKISTGVSANLLATIIKGYHGIDH